MHVVLQTTPQPPQLFGSLVVSMHLPPHEVCPASQGTTATSFPLMTSFPPPSLPSYWGRTSNGLEASAFLAAALTAGFVEEFVFRGYLQRQLTALSGSVVIGSALQVLLFIQGHYFQGLLRLIPVGVFGLLFTLLALWRKSLRPGMIAHALGDGFGPIMFFVKLL